VYFDGVDDVMALPSIAGIRSISLWLYLPPKPSASSRSTPSEAFVLDAVSSVMSGYSLSTHMLGSAFSHMYVDAQLQNLMGGVQPHQLMPSQRWLHLHLEAAYLFNARVNLMASQHATGANKYAGNLGGLLAEVYLWSAPIPPPLLQVLVAGFDYLDPALRQLLAHYPLEEAAGDVAHATGATTEPAQLLGRVAWSQDAPVQSGWHARSVVPSPPMPPPQSPLLPPVSPPSPPSPPPAPIITKDALAFDGRGDHMVLPESASSRGPG
jgi:hypothetical protein